MTANAKVYCCAEPEIYWCDDLCTDWHCACGDVSGWDCGCGKWCGPGGCGTFQYQKDRNSEPIPSVRPKEEDEK